MNGRPLKQGRGVVARNVPKLAFRNAIGGVALGGVGSSAGAGDAVADTGFTQVKDVYEGDVTLIESNNPPANPKKEVDNPPPSDDTEDNNNGNGNGNGGSGSSGGGGGGSATQTETETESGFDLKKTLIIIAVAIGLVLIFRKDKK